MRPGEASVVVQNTSTQKSLQVGVGILAAAAAIALLYFGRVFFITVIIASMIAFLLDPLVVIFIKLRLPRGLASFVVCSIALVTCIWRGWDCICKASRWPTTCRLMARASVKWWIPLPRHGAHRERDHRSVVPRFQPKPRPPLPRPRQCRAQGRRRTEVPIILPPICRRLQGAHPAGAYADIGLRQLIWPNTTVFC